MTTLSIEQNVFFFHCELSTQTCKLGNWQLRCNEHPRRWNHGRGAWEWLTLSARCSLKARTADQASHSRALHTKTVRLQKALLQVYYSSCIILYNPIQYSEGIGYSLSHLFLITTEVSKIGCVARGEVKNKKLQKNWLSDWTNSNCHSMKF